MSLVDRIKDINIGDLVLLNVKDGGKPKEQTGLNQIVGFVLDYSSDEIKLRNANTKTKDGSIRTGRKYTWNRALDLEKHYTVYLSECTSYEIIKKYEPSKY